MRKYIFHIATIAALAVVALACDKQDDTYRQYIVNGGYNYPAKAAGVSARAGYHKASVTWAVPLDPAVKTVKVYWDNYADSTTVSYSTAVDGYVTASIDNLEERSYTFDIVNFDGSGNRSLASEITVSPYGDGWLSTHASRRILSNVMVGDAAEISMGPAIDEMSYMKFRYKNNSGNWVESEAIPVDSAVVHLPDALKGKYYQYKFAYCPKDGLDDVWMDSWTKSSTPILFRLTPENWTITYTAKQVRSTDYLPDNMFDGDSTSRYYSTTNTTLRKSFPKIVVIDTNSEGDKKPIISSYKVLQHPTENKSRYVKAFNFYVGDEPYNPDDTGYLSTFGDPVVDATLVQTAAEQTRSFSPVSGRYIAIAFRSSYSSYGYIDVWEFEIYGYIPADAE